MITRLEAFQKQYSGFDSWSAFISKYSSDDLFKQEVYKLAKHFLHTTLSNCNSCYFDAYIQLILLKKEDAMAKDECLFGVRAGALLYGENNDLNLTNLNTTNELALYHIKRDPRCLKFFYKVPANLDELLAAMDKPTIDAEEAVKLEAVTKLEEAAKLLEEAAKQEAAKLEEAAKQEAAETEFINMLVDSIKEGADDATLALGVADQEMVGTKKLTKKLLAAYVAAAHKLTEVE